ncbi:transporter [Novosphingobium lentum]|uniref:transporter n=1 Tax=Novosphingobium lentum TaxID=145287 RepID=UPI001470270B|nr:transporter [Novosphingobium lentum]
MTNAYHPRALSLVIVLAAGVFTAAPALAEDREFCANRPGLDTPPCTMAPGTVMAEVGLAGIQHSSDGGASSDVLTAADLALRVGIAQSAELELGVTGFVRDRETDASGQRSTTSGVGDSFVAIRRGLAGPNGPVAIQVYATLPTGKAGVGAGDWGAGVLLPMQFDIGHGFSLALTPEVDAAVNSSGNGRHLAYGSAGGLSHPLTKALTLTGELAAFRDNDPGGHATQVTAAGSLAWQVADDWQLDLEGDAGLNHNTPDYAIMIGVARRIR